MANTLKQTIFQVIQEEIPERMIVQFIDNEGTSMQNIVNYSELTPEEKTTFDAFKELSISKMV